MYLSIQSKRNIKINQTKTLILIPFLNYEKNSKSINIVPAENRIEEIKGLAEAIDLAVCACIKVNIAQIRPATFIGKGRIEELSERIKQEEIELVIIDTDITPIQQRNLEKLWQCKIIDRTALILEIFGERARTKEGILQVELAHLNYQKGRLVRSWTHLERQRGGGGFLGGPGETQIESDRRQLQEKILRIQKQLDKVVKTRNLHREKRKKKPYPIIALVGYTNAGKSTLFNYLTGANVLAKNMLFATLDPTLRKVTLPHGETIIFSDTVGFISNLPTHLIAAFRATLEEVLEADLIVHVRDISNPHHHIHAQHVMEILKDLGIDNNNRIIELWNKIDLLKNDAYTHMKTSAQNAHLKTYFVSAHTGEGIEEFLKEIEEKIFGKIKTLKFKIPLKEQAILPLIYQYCHNIMREDLADGAVKISANITEQKNIIFQKMKNNIIKSKNFDNK